MRGGHEDSPLIQKGVQAKLDEKPCLWVVFCFVVCFGLSKLTGKSSIGLSGFPFMAYCLFQMAFLKAEPRH